MNSSELSAFACLRCNSFLIDSSLSTAEQHQQMKEHLETTHPYWDIETLGAHDYKTNFRLVSRQRRDFFCGQCKTNINPKSSFCPNCGAYKTGYIEAQEKGELGRTSIDRKQLFGIIGSILLFIGVFTPIISAPIVGSINYFQNGKGDGVIVLVLALISIGLVVAKKYRGLWITGVGSLAVMLITFVNFQVRMSQMQDEMETKLAGNPFRGIADIAMQSIQIQWGWAVLVVGAALLIAAAGVKR